MKKENVSKTTDLEQLQFSVDAAGKMVNAATSLPSSNTLHRAAHETLHNAEEAVKSALKSTLEADRLAGKYEQQFVEEIDHQFDVSE